LDKKLPQEFCKYWFDSFQEAYAGEDTLPQFVSDLSDDRKQTILTFAFLRLWLVLWFQTGAGIPGLAGPARIPAGPPPNCSAEKPSWQDPSDPSNAAAPPGPAPPVPKAETEDDDLLQTISKIIAALLGAAYFITGQLLAGGGAVAFWVASLKDN